MVLPTMALLEINNKATDRNQPPEIHSLPTAIVIQAAKIPGLRTARDIAILPHLGRVGLAINTASRNDALKLFLADFHRQQAAQQTALFLSIHGGTSSFKLTLAGRFGGSNPAVHERVAGNVH
ncbi:hypothetical protein [Geothrix sp. PMB-07]|uniref:hypothetical protein n=1 Tax=Geothrix sp. PMB-07 TaxID=3068640 RepID=UPI0027420552|nr:hypothetical protein [Geothrix sp. PMB-07]WLT32473.1 hypothetical protein Q9293_03890 [Geothrix sp. PMB-07]